MDPNLSVSQKISQLPREGLEEALKALLENAATTAKVTEVLDNCYRRHQDPEAAQPLPQAQAQQNNMARKRPAMPSNDRRSIEDDLICPITLNLPFDPVIAMDGRVYERYDIEQYFTSRASSGGEIRSPITKQVIATKLLPAVQHKNQIEFLVEKGLIHGDLADKWKEKVHQEKNEKDLLKKKRKNLQDSQDKVFRYAKEFFDETDKYSTTALQIISKIEEKMGMTFDSDRKSDVLNFLIEMSREWARNLPR